MTKKTDLSAITKTISEFSLLGITVGLFLFGYYVNRKKLQFGLIGVESVYFRDYMLFSCFSSGIALFISASFFLGKKRARSLEAKKNLSDLQDLPWRDFEEYIRRLFGKLGYSLDGNGSLEPLDPGADMKLKRDGRVSLVRCRKYYVRRVPLSMVREFYNAVVAEPALEKGYFITTGFFTPEAKAFSDGKPVELIDGERLMDFVRIADSIDALQSSVKNGPVNSCP